MKTSLISLLQREIINGKRNYVLPKDYVKANLPPKIHTALVRLSETNYMTWLRTDGNFVALLMKANAVEALTALTILQHEADVEEAKEELREM